MFSETTTQKALAIDNLHLEPVLFKGQATEQFFVTDGEKQYGICSELYNPVSHKKALSNVQEWLPEGKVVNTYSEDGLRRVVFNIELPRVYELAGDEIRTYVNLRNSLDGRWKLGLIVSPVDVVCHNTFVLSLKKAFIDISAKHTRKAVEKFFQEVRLVDEVYAALEGQLQIAEKLRQRSVTTAAGKEFLERLIKGRVIGRKVGEAAGELFEKPRFSNEEQRNFLGLFNTVTNVLSRELEQKETIGAYEKILAAGEAFAEVV